MCEGLTARQLDAAELFLNVDRSWGAGWSSCTQMPTSLSVAVGVFADDSVAATNDSDNMGNEEAQQESWIPFLPAAFFYVLSARRFFCRLITSIDKRTACPKDL